MKVAEVMTPNVICTNVKADVRDVAQSMLRHHISGLPVLDDAHALVGIVTEGDLLRRTEYGTDRTRSKWRELLLGPGRLASEFIHAHSRRVEDVMNRNVISVSEDTPVEEAVDLMERHGIKRIPVLAAGRVVGIVSRSSLLRLLAKGPDLSACRSDQEIADAIRAELQNRPWGAQVGPIRVSGGVVDVRGVTYREDERRAVIVAIENIPGVKAVHDHMVWVEPYTGTVLGPT